MAEARYAQLVSRELESYRKVRPELALPSIFTYWATKHLSPRMRQVMGTASPEEFFALHLRQAMDTSGVRRIASLGCGDCASEIDIARQLIASGKTDFQFDCFDLSPHVLQRANDAIAATALSQFFRLHVADINQWSSGPGVYAGVMVNHALHHLAELEHVFSAIANGLHDQGLFVNADMIGRNGHMRWPEALVIIQDEWRNLPSRCKYNHLLHRQEEEFINWDCSKETFEGIRAQDILSLLVKQFGFVKFLAFGNLMDVFVERTFGPNFSPNRREDTAFIDFLEELNTTLINASRLKPTQMFAVMTKQAVTEPVCDRGWTPEFCIRDPRLERLPAVALPEQLGSAPIRTELRYRVADRLNEHLKVLGPLHRTLKTILQSLLVEKGH